MSHHCHHDHENQKDSCCSQGSESKHSCSDSCCCCCCHDSCGTSCHHHHDKDFSHELLELADEAWMEILKDKIKQQIISSSGKNLDKLAKLVSDANQKRWQNKLGVNKVVSDFKEKIAEHFGKE